MSPPILRQATILLCALLASQALAAGAHGAADPFVAVTAKQDLWHLGNPTLRDWIRTLPQGAGTQAQPDLFAAPLLPGTAGINLRGLGSEQTTVSLNGFGLAKSPLPSSGAGGQFVNINQVPSIALEQVGIASNGRGLGGTVQMQTRDDFLGVEFSYDRSFVSGNGGDEQLAMLWGTQVKTQQADTHLLLAASADVESSLEARQRDWTQTNTDPAFAAPLPQQDCDLAGGSFADNTCRLRLGTTIQPVEDEEHDSVLLQVRHRELKRRGGRTFRIALLWGRNQLGQLLLPASWPWRRIGATAPLPARNPAVLDFMQRNNGAPLAQAQEAAVPGRASNGAQRRGVRASEDRLFNFEMDFGSRRQHNLAFHAAISDALARDPLVRPERYDLALRGYGGPQCDALNGMPGEDRCEYYNPFATGSVLPAVNPMTGAAYTDAERQDLHNSEPLNAWLIGQNEDRYNYRTRGMTTAFNGEIKQTSLANISWGWGFEYRQENWKQRLGVLKDSGQWTGNRAEATLFTDWRIPLGGRVVLDAGGKLIASDTQKLSLRTSSQSQNNASHSGELFPYLGLQWQWSPASDEPQEEDHRGKNHHPPRLSARLNWQADHSDAPMNQLLGSYDRSGFNARGDYVHRQVEGNPDLDDPDGSRIDWGLRFQRGRLSLAFDWWQVELDNPIVYDLTGTDTANHKPATDDSIVVRYYNSGPLTAVGNDLSAEYLFGLAEGYSLLVGTLIATTSQYDISVRSADGMVGYDALGRLNTSNWVHPIAESRIQTFLHLAAKRHNLRFEMSQDSGYLTDDDESIEAWNTLNAHYVYHYRDGRTQLSLSAINLTDNNPPLVPTELGYNALSHFNRGSLIRISFRHTY